MSIHKSALVLLVFSVPLVAGAVTCSPKMGPAEQIACLQTQNAVLKELIQNRELYKKLDDHAEKKTSRHLPLPLVLSIFGVGQKVQAVLSYAGQGGGSLTVTVGDELPDGWRVQSIGNGRVQIAKGRLSHILLLANGAPAQQAPESINLGLTPPPAPTPATSPVAPTVPAFGIAPSGGR